MNKIITFDFDGTLDRQDVQKYVLELMSKGVEVYVLTSRFDELHKHNYTPNPCLKDLYAITDSLSIKRERIFFTNMEPKYKFLAKTKVLAHLDDMEKELSAINTHTTTIAIDVESNYQIYIDHILSQ